MIIKLDQESRLAQGFGVYSDSALTALKGETFRVYCFILGYPTHKKDGTAWDIKPKEIAESLGIVVATVMRAFRDMRELGYMTFETDEYGNVKKVCNARGQVVSAAQYSFFEVPELNPVFVSNVNQFKNETGSQKFANQFKNETGTSLKIKQAAIDNMNLDQTEIIKTYHKNREQPPAPDPAQSEPVTKPVTEPVTGPLTDAMLTQYQPLGIYGHYFPEDLKTLDNYSRELINAYPHKSIFNTVCSQWKGNGNRGRSVSRILERCREVERERASPTTSAGPSRRTTEPPTMNWAEWNAQRQKQRKPSQLTPLGAMASA